MPRYGLSYLLLSLGWRILWKADEDHPPPITMASYTVGLCFVVLCVLPRRRVLWCLPPSVAFCRVHQPERSQQGVARPRGSHPLEPLLPDDRARRSPDPACLSSESARSLSLKTGYRYHAPRSPPQPRVGSDAPMHVMLRWRNTLRLPFHFFETICLWFSPVLLRTYVAEAPDSVLNDVLPSRHPSTYSRDRMLSV